MGVIVFLVYLFLLAIILWVNYLIAREFYRAANAKGFYEKKYLWLPFWLGMVGYLLVITLPMKRIEVSSFAEENQYTPKFQKQQPKNLTKVCPECGKEIPERSESCPVCGYPF